MHWLAQLISRLIGIPVRNKFLSAFVTAIFLFAYVFSPTSIGEGINIYAKRETASLMKHVFQPLIDRITLQSKAAQPRTINQK